MKKASTKIYIVMNKKMRYNLLGMPHFCFVLVGNLWDREKKWKVLNWLKETDQQEMEQDEIEIFILSKTFSIDFFYFV